MKLCTLAVGIIVLSLVVLIAWVWPLPDSLLRVQVSTTRILDRQGVLLYDQRSGGLQRHLSHVEIPRNVLTALIATEDRTFQTNPGISLRGIVRALSHDLLARRALEGGSGITQQYVRLQLQPIRRTILYKIYEAWLALKVTSRFSKDDIVDLYLNHAYFGQQSYGIAAAAMTYFGKNPSELSLSECALLVGLLNAPTALNPFKDLPSATERRNLVLRSMLSVGSLTSEEYDEALQEPVHLSHGRIPIRAPHFVMWQLATREAEWSGADDVRTTLDTSLQSEVEQIVTNQLQKIAGRSVTSAAVVVLDAITGDVLSMVGSGDYFDAEHDGQVNVTLSARQPGSAIKPFTYALALEDGMTPASTVADVESEFLTKEGTSYTPRNFDYAYHGLVRLREALGNSYNIAAIKVLQRVGVQRLLGFLQQLGLSTLTDAPDHYGLALTLGDSDVKLLELARAYAVFARGGRTLSLRTLLSDRIESGQQLLDPAVAWLIADMLSDNDARSAEFGRDSPLAFPFPVAAKTGTTRNSRDNWTIGFTPNRIVGVWVGNADNTPMRGTSGITGAAPIFHDVLLASLRGKPHEQFVRPAGIVDREICRLSGKLMTSDCPASLIEHFIEGTEPKEKDDLFMAIPIDRRNGLLAGSGCDPSFTEQRAFAVFPPEVRAWARDNGWPLVPTTASPLCRGGSVSSSSVGQRNWLTITSPSDGASYRLDPLIPDADEKIRFDARANDSVESIEWRVDGSPVGSGYAADFRLYWRPHPGLFQIEARSQEQSDRVRIEIRR